MAAGLYDVVLVTGVEKMTSQQTPRVAEILAMAGECCTEGKAGATFPALFAMIARRHMHQYGTKREHLAAVAVKNHANGAKNPDAHMRKVITLEQAMAGKPIADPLTVYDCSLVSDGAASVVLAPLERARELTDKPVRVLGIAQTSDYVALDRKEDITVFAGRADGRRRRHMRWPASDPTISNSPRCTTASPSLRSSRSKILGSFRRARAVRTLPRAARALTGAAPGEYQRRAESERPSGRRHRCRADLRPRAADSRRSRRAAGCAARHRAGAESRRIRRIGVVTILAAA